MTTMRSLLLAVALLVGSATCSPAEKRQLLSAPSAVIKNGTVIGSRNLLTSVDSFMGIPFAQPPVGTNRLRNPSPVQKAFGTITATATPTACPQYAVSMPVPSGLNAEISMLVAENPLFQAALPMGEDCLTINVQRPSNVGAKSKVPVLAYIYGGGFEAGSSSMYDGTVILQQATMLNHPLVYVTMNYRTGGFGFLAGKQIQNDGVSNLGLKDQRLALKWIQENIAAFGGDPDRVTIWGESAGAISVVDHTLINNGDNTYNGKPLFLGGISNSGSLTPTLEVSSSKAQAVYDAVVANSPCANASSTDSLNCLRTLSEFDFQNAAESVPGIFDYQSVALSYIPRPDPKDSFFSVSPEVSVMNGKFSKTPVINGDQEDEGTLFSLVTSNISTSDELVTYLNTYLLTGAARSDVQKLVDSYPDDPAQGSPFGTGSLYNLYPQYKRLAALSGDIIFTLTRREYLNYITNGGVKAWSYLNRYLHPVPLNFLGTFHASDILVNRAVDLFPAVRAATLTYYISFTYYQDPNKIANVLSWPQWTPSIPQLVEFNATSIGLTADNFRQNQFNTLVSLTGKLRT